MFATLTPNPWARRLTVALSLLAFAGCIEVKKQGAAPAGGSGASAQGSGETGATGESATATAPQPISAQGSSTVYPIAQAIAEVYRQKNPGIQISVGSVGTGGGFKDFAKGDVDICNASRPIRDTEKEACAKAGVEYLELEIAIDALTVVINPANDWAPCMSVSQLKKLWEPDSKVTKWSDIDPSWPAEKIELFGADTDSGTFDYFTEAIVGKAKLSRTDYTPNSNDNVLVQGVVDAKYGLGYFGYGYYVENKERLKAVAIKATDDAECVSPSAETVDNGTYVPLSRPLFIYVNKKSLKRKEIAEYVQFFLSPEGQSLVTERKFLLSKPDVLKDMQARLADALK